MTRKSFSPVCKRPAVNHREPSDLNRTFLDRINKIPLPAKAKELLVFGVVKASPSKTKKSLCSYPFSTRALCVSLWLKFVYRNPAPAPE